MISQFVSQSFGQFPGQSFGHFPGQFFEAVASFIITLISSMGYTGIGIAMAIESACIPLPSEIIMPFSGFLVAEGRFGLWQVGLAGAVGNLIGSILTYLLGAFGGRDLILKYGRYFFVSAHDLERADAWFARFGSSAIFFSRLLPIIRTFISLPAGISRMPFIRFCLYTLVGSYPWCYGLAWAGKKLGEHWDRVGHYFHRFDLGLALIALGGVVLWTIRHFKKPRVSADTAAGGNLPGALRNKNDCGGMKA